MYFDDNYKLRNEFQVIDNKVYYDQNKGIHLVDGIRYYFDFNDGHLIRSNIKSVIDISSWQGDIVLQPRHHQAHIYHCNDSWEGSAHDLWLQDRYQG